MPPAATPLPSLAAAPPRRPAGGDPSLPCGGLGWRAARRCPFRGRAGWWTATRCLSRGRAGWWTATRCLSRGRAGRRAAPRFASPAAGRAGGQRRVCPLPRRAGRARAVDGDPLPSCGRAGWRMAPRLPLRRPGGLAGGAAFASPAAGWAGGQRRVCLSRGRWAGGRRRVCPSPSPRGLVDGDALPFPVVGRAGRRRRVYLSRGRAGLRAATRLPFLWSGGDAPPYSVNARAGRAATPLPLPRTHGPVDGDALPFRVGPAGGGGDAFASSAAARARGRGATLALSRPGAAAVDGKPCSRWPRHCIVP
jgi:hypothetical protein